MLTVLSHFSDELLAQFYILASYVTLGKSIEFYQHNHHLEGVHGQKDALLFTCSIKGEQESYDLEFSGLLNR